MAIHLLLKERVNSYTHTLLFYLALKGLDYIHHINEGITYLFSPPIHMLLSSRNTFIDTSRNNVLPAIWAAVKPSKLKHKIVHYCNSNKNLWSVYTLQKVKNL
jgi:hypothetical protein